MRQTGLTERPALLLVFSLPQNKADLPLVTSKSAEMITRALRSITVSTCHQKVSEKADRRHKSDQGTNNSKPDVKGNDAEVSNSSALPSLPLLHAVNHFIPSLLLLCSCLCKSANFLPSKRAEWRKAERGGESSTIRSEEEGRGRRKRWREDLRACVYSFSLQQFWLTSLCRPPSPTAAT